MGSRYKLVPACLNGLPRPLPVKCAGSEGIDTSPRIPLLTQLNGPSYLNDRPRQENARSATVRIGITGAGGFVGSALVARLVAAESTMRVAGALSASAAEIVAIDTRLPSDLPNGVERAEGDICDRQFVESLFRTPFDAFLHLAAIPGGAAARDYPLGWRVNFEGSHAIVEKLAAQGNFPRLVFASTIGVFGTPYPPDQVSDDTLPLPTMSYGAQKLMIETLVSDFARRGLIDGLSVRLSGVLARPRVKGGHLSAYMSDILHALRAGEQFTCPVSQTATSWFVSRRCVVDNLVHAMALPAERVPARRAFTLPALRLSMTELVEAAATLFGREVQQLVQYEPDAALEAQFGTYPPLFTAIADAAGFHHDGHAVALIANALEVAEMPAK